MLKNMKITAKILLLILGITLSTLVIVSVLSYNQLLSTTAYLGGENVNLGLTSSNRSKQALLDQAEQYLGQIGETRTSIADNRLKNIRIKVTEMSEFMTGLYEHPDNFAGRELPLPDETEKGVPSSKYMLAPGTKRTEALEEELRLVSNAEYAFAAVLKNDPALDNVYLGTESGISYRFSPYNEYNPDYDPRERIWYTEAKNHQPKAVWVDTYIDSFGTVCITCAQAFYNANGEFAGVVAMDILLDSVIDAIMDVRIGKSGYAFIVDRNGEFIAHPKYPAMDENYTLEMLFPENGQQFADAVRLNPKGLIKATVDGTPSYLNFARLEETKWKICILINLDEIIEPANNTKAEIDTATHTAQEEIQDTLRQVITNYVIMFAAVGIVVIVLSFAISGQISRPIQKLAEIADKIGKGDLKVKAEVDSNDEIGELARTINSMTDDLRSHIKELTAITADKERIKTELDVARNIQASMLPCIFPAFPKMKQIDIYATMSPAKEVGGDFYDFFLVDPTHLAIVMADVSGKGIPAALFMVIGKTLIKDHTQPGIELGDVFGKVNDLLCEANSEGLFITAFEGVLDLTSGEFNFVNAGHELPIIYREGEGFKPYKIRPGFVLAGMEGIRYKAGSLTLNEGDRIFQYTDGVTEATNSRNELYGMNRLEAVLNSNVDSAPKVLLENIKADIDSFVGDAPQFDDITMLCLDFKEKLKPEE